MCGIAGIISINTNNVSRQRLQSMTDSIQHRGPEGDGFWINESGTTGFGHRRLSIIDLSEAGNQPMHYLSRYTITYNGEIYNYKELYNTLKKKGYSFISACDTEVILAAYACYGKECLQHFDGMFAFAIWDEQEQTLFCARDRFGEKPFYFYETNDSFLFASEMKTLWAAGAPKQMDNTMLLHYIALGSTVHPSNHLGTFYADIFKLPRGHYLQLKTTSSNGLQNTSYEITSYWDIDKETIIDITEDEATEQFQQLLTTSVQRRLRSDVPLGTSLSGGLDSSSIAAIMQEVLNVGNKQKAFSAVFPGFEKDESKQIEKVSTAFNLESFTVTPTAEGLINDFEKLIHHQEEPFQSSSIYAQYKVYELAKQQGITVLLDGQGADEILAGYHKYYHWYWQELIGNGKWKMAAKEIEAAKAVGVTADWGFKNYAAAYLPSLTAKQLEKKAAQQIKHHPCLTKSFTESTDSTAKVYKPIANTLNDMLYFNTMQNGLEELLRYADRNSMAHSREVRLPFLNHELVQFIFSLPSHFKIKNGYTKWILRNSMSNKLPNEIVWRKDKVGFEPPQKQWMQQKQMQEYIHEAKKALVSQNILKADILSKLSQAQSAHESGNFDWRYLCAAKCMG